MRARNIKVGLHIPAASSGPLPSSSEYIEFFKQSEAMGYDSLWTEDRIFHGANFLEPLTLLSWAAANTERIQLGTAVLLLALRNAPALARQISSMDYLSGGRLNLGISIGGRPAEYLGLGLKQSERVAHLRESITVLNLLLSGEPVTYSGRFYKLDEATVRPGIARPGGVPLYMGGRVDAVLQRAAEMTNGWIGGPFSPPEDYRTTLDTVHKILNTNVVGTFLFSREAAKLMQRNKFGRIVNFATVATPLRLEGEAIYASSKAAVISLTQILARELADMGITINAIGPTPVKTDLIKAVPENKLNQLLNRQAIHRFGGFDDIANIIDFFIKPESSFITGQVIYLGGV